MTDSMPVVLSVDDSSTDEVQAELDEDGGSLWSLVAGRGSSVACEVAEKLQMIDEMGVMAPARLKALTEVMAVLRSSPTGVAWDEPIAVPAGDLVLLMQMVLQRLS